MWIWSQSKAAPVSKRNSICFVSNTYTVTTYLYILFALLSPIHTMNQARQSFTHTIQKQLNGPGPKYTRRAGNLTEKTDDVDGQTWASLFNRVLDSLTSLFSFDKTCKALALQNV